MKSIKSIKTSVRSLHDLSYDSLSEIFGFFNDTKTLNNFFLVCKTIRGLLSPYCTSFSNLSSEAWFTVYKMIGPTKPFVKKLKISPKITNVDVVKHYKKIFPNVSELDIHSQDIQFSSFPVFGRNLKRLKYRYISGYSNRDYSNSGYYFCKFKNLKELILINDYSICLVDKDFRSLKKLEHLKMSMCLYSITGEAFKDMSYLKQLNLSNSYNIRCFEDGFKYLKSLECLQMSNCSFVTDDFFTRCITNLKTLKSLDLSWCIAFSEDTLKIITEMENLNELFLIGCKQFKLHRIVNIFKKKPGLRVVFYW